MNLIVESSSEALAHAVAAELAAFGSVTVRGPARLPTAVELLHRPGIDTAALLGALQPLQPAVRAVADLDADAVLRLGDVQPLSAWNVRIECDFLSRSRANVGDALPIEAPLAVEHPYSGSGPSVMRIAVRASAMRTES